MQQINLEKDFIKQVNKAIKDKEDIQIRIRGEQREGMSLTTLKLSSYYRNSIERNTQKEGN